MGIVTSFFPGHIRLRGAIFKDSELANAAIKAIKGVGFSGTFTHNPKTGSILVEYDPSQITKDKVDRLRPMLAEFMRLKPRVFAYNPKDKEFLLKEIDRLAEEATSRLS